MTTKTEQELRTIAVNEWNRYIEKFGKSRITILQLRIFDNSWEDIVHLCRNAIETDQEIDLIKRR